MASDRVRWPRRLHFMSVRSLSLFRVSATRSQGAAARLYWLLFLFGALALGFVARPQAQANCPCSVWPATATPGPVANDPNAVELGVKFRADSNGYITGLRFYKYSQNTGTHVGSLWSAGGTLLGTLTFNNETLSGWQEGSFQTPVAITAGTTYVASYHTNTGFYPSSNNGLSSAVDNAPLHALSDGSSGGNGVYRYTANSAFPSQSFQGTNYWVDVVYVFNQAPDTTPPTVASTAPSANGTGVPVTGSVRTTFSEPIDPATVTASTMTLRVGATQVAASVTYSNGVANLAPNAALATATTYVASVKGGSSGVKDLAGNALATDVTWSFTTAPPAVSPLTGAGGPILVVASASNPFSQYYPEILRAEGLNEFSVANLSNVTASVLASYDVV